MAEEGGDYGLMLELLGFLGGYRITLRDGEQKSRLEVVGGLGGACLWAFMGGKMVPFLSS